LGCQRAKAFAEEFLFDVEAILAIGIDVRVPRRRQMPRGVDAMGVVRLLGTQQPDKQYRFNTHYGNSRTGNRS
jgi:hypothetical protein